MSSILLLDGMYFLPPMWASFVDALGDGSCLSSEGCTEGVTDRDQEPLGVLAELDPFDVVLPELDSLDEVTEPSHMTARLITARVRRMGTGDGL